MKKYALLSVSDKSKIVELASALNKASYEILATGKTFKILSENNIKVMEVSDFTGFPEVFHGRVKTLNPKIFGGILYRRDNESDLSEFNKYSIQDIDVVCVNLYPFIKTVENPESSFENIIENIDIGGPSLIRAAAKNYKYVSVLTDPLQYDRFMQLLEKDEISLSYREQLAASAFAYTSYYDTYIADFLEKKFSKEPDHFRLNLKKEMVLRYGENPHQKSEVYGSFSSYFQLIHGKELSYNNILDVSSAVELVEDLGNTSCVIVKHNNPAGACSAENNLIAYEKALKCDPVSAFGGIVAFNTAVDKKTAEKLNEIFLEVISAPDYSEEALNILKKKKDRRIIKQISGLNKKFRTFKSIPGGVIVQDNDSEIINNNFLNIVSDKKPSEKEMEDLVFAMTLAKHTRSNAIVFVKDKVTLGIGAGQMSRLDSCKIAVLKAKEHGLDLKGSVAGSDAFFPFADGLLEIIKAGSISVIQPGGSVRDNEVIEAANSNNISMVFTGIRHFKH